MPDPVQGVVFDLDGTLYRDDSAAMAEAYLDAGSRAAVALGAPLTLKDARRIASEAFQRHGAYAPGFVRHGVDARDFHFKFHELLDERAIEPVAGVTEAFRFCWLRNFVLLTHASRDWAERSITRLGLEGYFPPDRIIAFEDYGFCGKDVGTVAFKMALARLETHPYETVLVEDSRRNLPIPAAMGIKTVLVNYRRPGAPTDPHAYLEVTAVTQAIDLIAVNKRATVTA